MKTIIPLTRPTLPKAQSLLKSLSAILSSGMITEHKYVREFEERCAKYLGTKYIISVTNGTSALILTLKCLDLEGEVILPSFTYSSGAHALLWCGLIPVFADINKDTFNLDPSSVEKKITKRTSAILPTHVFGNPCDIRALSQIAQKYRLKLILDAAHAFGSQYHNKSVALFGDASIYSLTPTKVLTTGEGGLIATDNEVLKSKLRIAKLGGDSFNRDEEILGLTARMSEFHAIIGIENLKLFKKMLKRRLQIVADYKQRLSEIDGIKFQKIENESFSVYKDLTILIDPYITGFSRNELLEVFRKNGVQSRVYFDPPLHKKKVYVTHQNVKLPNTDFVSDHILSLPLYSHMPISEVKKVCAIITELNKLKKQ